MNQIKCSLVGCSFHGKGNVGISAHERGHVMRGEAQFGSDGKLVSLGKGIAVTLKERKERMAQHSRELAVQQTPQTAVIVANEEVVNHPQPSETEARQARAKTRLKEAVVLMEVADMLDDVSPDALNVMLGHLKSMTQR